MTTLTFTYTWSKWDEVPLADFTSADTSQQGSSPSTQLKFTKIASDRIFEGDLTGTGWDESVMVYHPSTERKYDATYSGLVHVQGEVQGEQGEAVFVINGRYTDELGVVSEWRLDEPSATGWWKGKKAAGGDGKVDGDPKRIRVVLRVHDA